MGYTTNFTGKFKFNKKLDKETLTFLTKLSETRRMKRKVDAKYGIDGEFYVDGKGFRGQDHDKTVIDDNRPPSTQPGLWLQWTPSKDGKYLIWDGGEKFYCYVEWLQYLMDKILIPRGYSLTGVVHWTGENDSDIGTIQCVGTEILVEEGIHKKELRPNSVRFIADLEKEINMEPLYKAATKLKKSFKKGK